MQSMVAWSLNHDITSSLGLRPTHNFQKSTLTSSLKWHVSVRVHPYAHPLHTKVQKHFLYI